MSSPSVNELLKRVTALEDFIQDIKQTTICLSDIFNITHGRGTLKDKVVTLLSHANIPYYWIVDINQHHLDSNQVIIYFINSIVTHVASLRLQQYLHNNTIKNTQ